MYLYTIVIQYTGNGLPNRMRLDHEYSRPLFKKDKYSMLNMYYRNLIDTYLSKIAENGYVKSTIYSRQHILTGFFYYLQVNNITSLNIVTEDVVLGYFYDGEKELKGADYLQMLKSSIGQGFCFFLCKE